MHPALLVLEAGLSRISTDSDGLVKEAAEAAVKGAEATKTMKAQAGRASYVAAEKVDKIQIKTRAFSY